MSSQLEPRLSEYLETLEVSQDPLINEMEQIAKDKGFPIVGHQCAKRMATLCMAIGATSVVELGSGFGYSTMWLAKAVGEGGKVVHTEFDLENIETAKSFLSKAGLIERVHFHNGDGLDFLSQSDETWDAVFIDADKVQYPQALKMAVEKVREGGWIFAHNVVWSGKVADPANSDESTNSLREYLNQALTHPHLFTYIDPVHDGLAISLKTTGKLF